MTKADKNETVLDGIPITALIALDDEVLDEDDQLHYEASLYND